MGPSRADLASLVVFVTTASAAAFLRPAVTGDTTHQAAPDADESPTLLARVPSTASLVVTLDVNRLRRTELGAILGRDGRELWDLGRIDRLCGEDPTETIEALAIALGSDAAPNRDALGVVAFGPFSEQLIGRCAGEVIRARGGAPVVSRVGSFLTVRDRSREGAGEIAVHDGGPVLLASGDTLRDLVDTSEGRLPAADSNAAHVPLRRALGTEAEVVATWRPAPGWLEAAVGPKLARITPLSNVAGAAVAVEAKESIAVRAIAVCETEERCGAVADVASGLLAEEIAPVAAALGIHGLAERARPERDGRTIRLTLTLSAKEVEIALGEAMALLGEH